MSSPHMINDIDCLPFFQNVVKSKINQAQQHFNTLSSYKLFSIVPLDYKINDLTRIHEEQSDFITIVYKQCNAWRMGRLETKQSDKINCLEEMTRRLENLIYHILFMIEQINQNRHKISQQGVEIEVQKN